MLTNSSNLFSDLQNSSTSLGSCKCYQLYKMWFNKKANYQILKSLLFGKGKEKCNVPPILPPGWMSSLRVMKIPSRVLWKQKPKNWLIIFGATLLAFVGSVYIEKANARLSALGSIQSGLSCLGR